MNAQALLTDLTSEQEEKVAGGGNPVLDYIIRELLKQGLNPNSAYQQAVQRFGRHISRYPTSWWLPRTWGNA
jgi:hypothetical protein